MHINWIIKFKSGFRHASLFHAIRRKIFLANFVSLFVCFQVTNLSASSASECYHAARLASHETGVPHDVMLAITRVETGRTLEGKITPWPWAINHQGQGSWLSSEDELLETALELIAKGERSFDLGCFQLNYRWHGAEFASLDQMISPKENALYAAKFLKALYAEFGDWTEAAGAYHSRTEEHAKAYKAKFLVHYDDDPEMLQLAMAASAQTKVKRTNSYPLLVNRASRARLGSLMPETSQ
jgi:hypothetical protein